MADVTVTAIRSFLFNDKPITKGESVTMPAITAAVQARMGNVSLARVQVRSMKAETPKEEPPKPRRTRRTPRNGTPVIDVDKDTQPADASHQYRRRDMTAEDPT